jgi:hypothetical protein
MDNLSLPPAAPDRTAVTEQEPVLVANVPPAQRQAAEDDQWPITPEGRRLGSGDAVRPHAARFGFGDASSGPRSELLEVPPAPGGCGFLGLIGRVVIVELLLPFLRYKPKKAQMPIGHDRRPPGSGIGIETATASGSGWGTSSSLNRR